MRTNNRTPCASRSDNIVVRYLPHQRELPATERALVQRWAARWFARQPDTVVTMGCGGGATRAGRVARLRRLRDLLVDCGVPAEHVRYTGDPIGASPNTQEALGRPTVACLKAVSAQSLDGAVKPIRTLLQANPRLEPVYV
jgi:hypothetical protein